MPQWYSLLQSFPSSSWFLWYRSWNIFRTFPPPIEIPKLTPISMLSPSSNQTIPSPLTLSPITFFSNKVNEWSTLKFRGPAFFQGTTLADLRCRLGEEILSGVWVELDTLCGFSLTEKVALDFGTTNLTKKRKLTLSDCLSPRKLDSICETWLVRVTFIMEILKPPLLCIGSPKFNCWAKWERLSVIIPLLLLMEAKSKYFKSRSISAGKPSTKSVRAKSFLIKTAFLSVVFAFRCIFTEPGSKGESSGTSELESLGFTPSTSS